MKKLHTFLKIILNIFLALIEFFTFYFIVAVILSIIPYNTDYNSGERKIEIFILSNGIHTDIVLPAANEHKDWTQEIKFEHTLSGDTAMNYVAFGWGDKGFYLNTPRWADLKLSTAFKAMVAISTSAMHVTYYKKIRTGRFCRKIKIGKEAYMKLVKYIEASFQKQNTSGLLHIKGYHYGNTDSFYEANGSYNLFYTCNTWANEGLKSSGIKSCLWTPFDKGILYQHSDE